MEKNYLNCHHERSEGSAVGLFMHKADSSRQNLALVMTIREDLVSMALRCPLLNQRKLRALRASVVKSIFTPAEFG